MRKLDTKAHCTLASRTSLLLLLSALLTHAYATLPNVTLSGYVNLDDAHHGAKLFYALYEVQQPLANARDTPVLLWLQARTTTCNTSSQHVPPRAQGGPGCASMFGNLYELGPQRVRDAAPPTLEDAPWAWNRRHMALLFIDQPIGTGFSLRGHRPLPSDEAEIASDLYVALQWLWANQEVLHKRPLLIAGESYAGCVMLVLFTRQIFLCLGSARLYISVTQE